MTDTTTKIATTTRLPRFDVYNDAQSQGSSRATRRLHQSPAAKVSAAVDAFARWLLALCNCEEATFLLAHNGVCEAVEVSEGQSGRPATRHSPSTSSLRAQTDFALIISPYEAASPDLASAKCCISVSQDYPEYEIHSSVQTAEAILNGLLDAFLDLLTPPNELGAGLACSALNFPPAQPISRGMPQDNHPPDSQSNDLLHSAFERRALQHPDRCALEYLTAWAQDGQSAQTHRLSYRQLNLAADRLASALLERVETLSHKIDDEWSKSVPIFLGPSVGYYIGILACLKAGLAFSPLPVDAPPARLDAIIKDQRAPLVLYSSNTVLGGIARVQDITSSCEWMDTAAYENGSEDGEMKSASRPCVDDLAYILFTSGSTGLPKGVQITHASAALSISAHAHEVPISHPEETRWFQFAAPTFDPSVMEMFVTWGSGATLCSAPRSKTLEDVNRTVSDLQATIMMATPSLAALLRRDQLPTLKCLWTMGEALNDSVIRTFAAPSDSKETLIGLYNAYGPTEAAINCTLLRMEKTFRGTILGPPLPSCSLFVVDSTSLQPVPIGMAGELLIGGLQVSQKGYLRREKQSAASFVDVPSLGGRVYRTGDAARIVWAPDGAPWIEILGRIGAAAGQVKVHGQRVELSEIEAALMTNALAEVQSLHVVQTSSHGLCAVVRTSNCDRKEHLEKHFRDQAKTHLPPFSRPQFYVFTSRQFFSLSGKLDRRAMKAWVEESIQSDGQVPEQNSLDSTADRLAAALVRTTGTGTIDADKSIESYGLDSLGAMRLLDYLRRQSQDPLLARLSLKALFQDRTRSVRQVADDLARQEDSSQSRSQLEKFAANHEVDCKAHLAMPHDEDRIKAILPVTATQAGMLASFLRSRTYIHHFCFVLSADVDIMQFTQSAQQVLDTYDAFSSVFVPIDDAASPFAQCLLREVSHPALHKTVTSDRDITEVLQEAESAIDLTRSVVSQQVLENSRSGERTWALTVLHAVFDGGSLALLLDDIQAMYSQGSAVERPHGPALAAETYLRATAPEQAKATGRFWQAELDGFEAEEFPALHGLRPSLAEAGKASSDVVELVLSGVSLDALREAAADYLGAGASPLPLLQLAWLSMLASYYDTANTDACFGSVVSNRMEADAQECTAPTFTTIPVRLQVLPTASISELLKALADKSTRSMVHSQPELGSIVTRDGALPYDTLLAFQMFSQGEQAGADALWTREWSPAMANDFAVMLEVWPDSISSSLRLRATYKTSVLDDTSCRVMLHQYEAILQEMSQTAKHRSDLSLGLLMAETAMASPALFSSTGDELSDADMACPQLLHTQFEDYVTKTPQAIALVFQEKNGDLTELTYAKLNELSGRVTEALLKAAGSESLVDQAIPLYANKSVDLFVAVLGILKAGAAWCPIEPSLPHARKVNLVKRARTSCVVVSRQSCASNEEEESSARDSSDEFDTVMREAGVDPSFIIDVSTLRSQDGGSERAQHSRPHATEQNLAYLIWTSGSTGEPKGVLVEHRAARNAMLALQVAIPSARDSQPPRTVNFSAFTFDVFVQDLFYTWGLGGTVISAPRATLIDTESFVSLAARRRATHAHLTPAFGACLPRSQCSSLQVITMIGEKLGEDVAENWQGSADLSTSAWNTYGPAESAVVATYRSFQDDRKHKAANVGWPLHGVTCFVVSDDTQGGLAPTLRGGTGELVLGGAQLARGYLGQPEKTAQQYPTIELNGSVQRIYKTGDVVRMLSDGSLEFVGRTDDLIKLGGIRIELSEISHLLQGCHPAVKHIETLHIPSVSSMPDNKVLVSFLLALADCSPEQRSIIIQAATKQSIRLLPDYMRPARFMVVASIPRSTSAKTDKASLTRTFQAAVESGEFGNLASGDTEEDDQAEIDPTSRIAALARCVDGVVNGGSPSAKDHWRALPRKNGSCHLRSYGLDSIRMIRLAAQLRKEGLSTEVSAFGLMRCRTFADLCSTVFAVEHKEDDITYRLSEFDTRWKPDVARKLKMPTASIERVLPTTALQSSLLIETARSSSAYWSTNCFSVAGHTPKESVHQAWVSLVRQTEILRTVFVAGQTGYLHAILQPEEAAKMSAWKTLEAETLQDPAIQKHLLQTQQIFSKAGGLPWAVTIVEKQSVVGTWTLVVQMHHALYDKQTFDALMSELSALVIGDIHPNSLVQWSEALALCPPATVFQDPFTAPQEWDMLLQGCAARCEAWSLPDLTGARASSRPSARMHTTCKAVEVPAPEMAQVARKARLDSSAALIQAAFGCLVADYLEQGAVLIGSNLSLRNHHRKLENALGPLIVTVPFVIDGGRQTKAERSEESQTHLTIADLLASIARQSSLVAQDGYIGSGRIRKALQWPQDQPLYPALFVVHPKDERPAGEADEMFRAIEHPSLGELPVEHPFACNVYLDSSGHPCEASVSASSTILSEAHAEVFAQQLIGLVTALCRSDDTVRVSDLTPVSPTGGDLTALQSIQPPRIVNADTQAALTRHPCFWLRHWARHCPDRIAVEEVQSDISDASQPLRVRRWTYAELDAASDQLSHHLLSLPSSGQTPVVALCMGRTLEAFAAILAIFKSGYLYLPIAEDLPAERKASLIVDSQAIAVFTSRETQEELAHLEVSQIDEVTINNVLSAAKRPHKPLGNARDTGYLLFTSGSTGKPKGVHVSGANLSAFVEGYAALVLRHSDRSQQLSEAGTGRYLNLASRAFDPHLSQMFTAWRFGYAATTGPRSVLLADIGATVRRLSITHIGILPSLVEQAGLTPETAPTLALLGVGGEKVTPFVLDRWGQSQNDTLVLNLYGPTEATIGCAIAVVTPQVTPRNIGFPVGNLWSFVLVPGTDQVARKGQTGELCVAGDLVADGGYLGLSESQQGGFCQLPLRLLVPDADPSTQIRAYRTGDMVQMLSDGSLSFLGRSDEQIKIRGQRLELGEVTAAVRSAAASIWPDEAASIQAASVYTKHPSMGNPRLLTVLSLGAGSCPPGVGIEWQSSRLEGIAEMTSACKRKLPAFMVPTILMVKNMPKLPSGKIDVKRLTRAIHALDATHITGENAIHSATGTTAVSLTAVEESILKVICKTTGSEMDKIRRSVRSETSIFELGIDSLLAVGLAAQFRERPLCLDVDVGTLLRNDTLAKLASLAERQADETASEEASKWYEPTSFHAATLPLICQENVIFVRPCMPLQESLIALSRLGRQEGLRFPPYVHQMTLQPRSIAEVHVVQRWRRAIAAIPILRTAFPTVEDDASVQAILAPTAKVLDSLVMPRSNLDSGHCDPWDLIDRVESVPPIRVIVDEETQHARVWIHHALYDGHTLPQLLTDVYGAHSDLNCQYAAAADNEYDQDILESVIKAQGVASLGFWHKYLGGLQTPSRSLADRTSQSSASEQVGRIRTTWDSDTLADLQAAARSPLLQCTLSTLMQACFAVTLARELGTKDVVIGCVLSGRGRQGRLGSAAQSRMPTVTTIPVLHKLDPRGSLACAVKTTKESLATVHRWQYTSLRNIQRAVRRGGLFEVLYSFNVHSGVQTELSYRSIDNPDLQQTGIGYPLVLDVNRIGDSSVEWTMAYNTSCMSRDAAQALAERFSFIVRSLAKSHGHLPIYTLGIQDSPLQAQPEIRARPLTDKECQARDILLTVVKGASLNDVQSHTSFYQLGLDSMNVIRFAAELKKAGFVGLNAASILQSGNLASLLQSDSETSSPDEPKSSRLSAAQDACGALRRGLPDGLSDSEALLRSSAVDFEPLSPLDVLEAAYECTPLQSGMLTMSHAATDSAYHQVHHLTLTEGVDLSRLRQAWRALQVRQDILRTTFHLSPQQNRWIAVVHSDVPSTWDNDLAQKKEHDAFKYASLPRVQTRYQSGVWSLHFHLHHAVYDGASLPVLFRQLRHAYHKVSQGAKDHFDATPFHRVARQIRATQAEDVSYWSDQLCGFQPTPLSRAVSLNATSRWHATRKLLLSGEEVTTACRTQGVTLQAVCLLAYAHVLATSVTQRLDVCFGHVLGGRGIIEGDEQVMGPLFNTVARRVTFDDILCTRIEAVARAQRSLDESFSRQFAALRDVVASLKRSESNQTWGKLFECLFVYHKAKAGRTEGDDSQASLPTLWHASDNHSNESTETQDEYELNLSCVEQADGTLQIYSNASERVVSGPAELDHLTQQVCNTVSNILQQPHKLLFGDCRDMRHLVEKTQQGRVKPEQLQSQNGPLRKLSTDEAAFCDAIKTSLKNLLPDSHDDWRRPDQNVIALGIDSMTALRLVSVCRNSGNATLRRVNIPLILGAETVEKIIAAALGISDKQHLNGNGPARPSQYIDRSKVQEETAGVLAAGIGKGGVSTTAILSQISDIAEVLPGQLFHLDSWFATGRRFYEAPWVYKVAGGTSQLDEARVQKAWQSLRSRYAILRTTFVRIHSQERPVQVTFEEDSALARGFATVHKCSSSQQGDTLAESVIALGNASPSTLFTPPARLDVIVDSNGSTSHLVLRLHHALYDATSVRFLVSELERLVNADGGQWTTKASENATLSSTVKEVLPAAGVEAERNWWLQHLHESQHPTLLGTTTIDTVKTALGPQVLVRVPAAVQELGEIESRLAKATRVQLTHVVPFALGRVLSRRSKVDRHATEPVIGFFTGGRAGLQSAALQEQTRHLPLLNVLPLSVPVRRGTVHGLEELQKTMLSRVQWEQTHLKDVYEWWSSENGQQQARQPMFDVFLNLLWDQSDSQASGAEQGAKPRWELRHMQSPAAAAYFTSKLVHPLVDQTPAGPVAKTALGLPLTVERALEHLPPNKCYVDVRRNVEKDCLGFGVKADVQMFGSDCLHAESQLQDLCRDLAEEIVKVVDELCCDTE